MRLGRRRTAVRAVSAAADAAVVAAPATRRRAVGRTESPRPPCVVRVAPTADRSGRRVSVVEAVDVAPDERGETRLTALVALDVSGL